ncbi:MAG: class II glutamine amidotransferase [SAR202 cluster bacterium]|nr:class II glutamine amidotransferase [SAR202 cluster bacterium]
MCGISGIMYKNSRHQGLAPVGNDLVRMLDSLAHRGHDSTGYTIVGENNDGQLILRIWTGESEHPDVILARAQEAVEQVGCVVNSRQAWGGFLRLNLNYEGEIPELAEAILQTEGVVIHSIGEASEVIKDVGTASDMEPRHQVGSLKGTHGIGHVRMATESKVDITHSHPFWAYPFTDVTVVHNGQLTNYHKLKRHYEDVGGYRFLTDNDSELIAVYLADKLAQGDSLTDALRYSLEELDGTFTYLVSTKDGIGVAKDRWAAKPLVTMETDDVVAVASEEIALRSVFTDQELDRAEPQENEVLTWSV